MDVCLRVAGLTKQYGALRALDGVSFEVRSGEILGLIGPNGSGKTTLFECIGGVLPYDAGRIEHGEALFYLPDAIAPWPAQSVSWALDFAAGYFGAPSGMRDVLVSGLALEPLLDQRIGLLSKGQRKRALLAIGLLTSRSIVLADEPFEGLDLKQTRDVGAALRSFAREGRTLVLSIHQIGDAARVCDRFVLLSGGTVRGEGTLEELTALAAARASHPSTSAPPHPSTPAPPHPSTLEEAFLALT